MKIKKAIAKLDLLAENINKYKKNAFFGVEADSPEIQSIWIDYEDVRTVLIEENPELFGELIPIKLPIPDEASSFGMVDVGKSVYHPKHFSTIESQVKKALRFVELEYKSNDNELKIPNNLTINASNGANVAVQFGDNNKALQNVELIDNTLEEIEKLGINRDDLNNLKRILNQEVDKSETKAGIGKRIMNWAGKMTSKLIEKGLSDNIPFLIDKAEKLMDLI
ncbi:MAG: hypothetical protein WC599_05765 [Bacteroidales bacterium]